MKNKKIVFFIVLLIATVGIVGTVFVINKFVRREVQVALEGRTYTINVKSDWEVTNTSDKGLKVANKDGFALVVDIQPLNSSSEGSAKNVLTTVAGYIEIPYREESFIYLGEIMGYKVYRHVNLSAYVDEASSFSNARLYFSKNSSTVSNLAYSISDKYRLQIVYYLPHSYSVKDMKSSQPSEISELDDVLKSMTIK